MIFFLCCHIADRMFQFLFCTIFGHVTQIKSNNEFKQQNSGLGDYLIDYS